MSNTNSDPAESVFCHEESYSNDEDTSKSLPPDTEKNGLSENKATPKNQAEAGAKGEKLLPENSDTSSQKTQTMDVRFTFAFNSLYEEYASLLFEIDLAHILDRDIQEVAQTIKDNIERVTLPLVYMKMLLDEASQIEERILAAMDERILHSDSLQKEEALDNSLKRMEARIQDVEKENVALKSENQKFKEILINLQSKERDHLKTISDSEKSSKQEKTRLKAEIQAKAKGPSNPGVVLQSSLDDISREESDKQEIIPSNSQAHDRDKSDKWKKGFLIGSGFVLAAAAFLTFGPVIPCVFGS